MFQKILFLLMLFIGTLISISSNSWLIAWMGLEINLISFITLIIKQKNFFSGESSLIYFIFQAFASLLFLFSIIIYLMKLNLNFLFIKNMYLLMMISLLMKIGSAPFHFWLPIMMENLNWLNNFLLMTWQKIAPLILIFYMLKNFMLIIFILFSVLLSSLGGLNQTSIRKLMAFSSINQISWLLASMMINEILWKIYFLIYICILFNLIMLMNLFNIYFINQLFSMNFKFTIIKLLLFMNIMSMAGLPPFIGFFSKLMVIKELMLINMFMLIFIMLMFSLLMLFFYLRMMYSSFLFNMLMMKNYKLINMNKFMILLLNFINNFLLMMIFIYLLY